MSATFQSEKMGRLLTDLLVRQTTVGTGPKATIADPMVTASYAGEDSNLVGVCVCDLEFALNCGAALCLIPASEAANHLKAKRLDPAIFENFKEVLNICAQLFSGASAHRVKLEAVYAPTDAVPDPLKKFMAASKARRDLQLSINGYGKGKMTVFC